MGAEKKVILALTGASGAILGVRALDMLKELGVETHVVVSSAAAATLRQELDLSPETLESRADFAYSNADLAAPLASGSFVTQGMLILPCSIKTLSAVANSYTDSLITRAADVCLKEGRPLLLGVREAPLHAGHLELMERLARLGAIIYPPIPFFYSRPASLDEMVDALVARMLLRIGIDNSKYPRWQGL